MASGRGFYLSLTGKTETMKLVILGSFRNVCACVIETKMYDSNSKELNPIHTCNSYISVEGEFMICGRTSKYFCRLINVKYVKSPDVSELLVYVNSDLIRKVFGASLSLQNLYFCLCFFFFSAPKCYNEPWSCGYIRL